jgi:hypothetical protein
MEEKRKMSIAELELILERDEEVAITILPNGEVRMEPHGENTDPLKVLTFRENLGGEYGGKELTL